MWLACHYIKNVKKHCRCELYSFGQLSLKLEMGKTTVQEGWGEWLLIDQCADRYSSWEGPRLLFLPPGPEAGSMDCQMACEWRFETASRAERVLSAVPFNTKRQLLCGDAWCCYCMAGRSASLTLNSTSGADCSHKVMKTDSHWCHSDSDNTLCCKTWVRADIIFYSWLCFDGQP